LNPPIPSSPSPRRMYVWRGPLTFRDGKVTPECFCEHLGGGQGGDQEFMMLVEELTEFGWKSYLTSFEY